MKKMLKFICIALSIVVVISLSSCKNDSSSNNMDNTSQVDSSDKSYILKIDSETREKLNKLKNDFTKEQVHEIMGEPDEIPPTSIYREMYYLDNNITLRIIYFSDVISVELIDTIANKNEKIL